MAEFDQITKHRTLIAGHPIRVTRSTKTLNIAGEEIPMERWVELRRQIDLALARTLAREDWKALREKYAWLGKRDRLPRELRDFEGESPVAPSDFVTANLKDLLARKRGRIKPAPFPLSLKYDAMISKEAI